jgi:hypothetical protein
MELALTSILITLKVNISLILSLQADVLSDAVMSYQNLVDTIRLVSLSLFNALSHRLSPTLF